MGRTWERQAYIKARPVAGDLDLGQEFLRRLRAVRLPQVSELRRDHGIKALKRRIEQRADPRGGRADRDVKTGRGGIRDIEFTIQFLQLLNGGDLPALRSGNTLEALDRLERGGCLTHQERDAPRGHLPLPAQDRAPAAAPVRPADAPAAGRSRRAAQAGAFAMGYAQLDSRRSAPRRTPLAALRGRDYRQTHDAQPQDSRPPAARRLRRRHADRAGGRPGARPRPARRSASPRCWAATASATRSRPTDNLMPLAHGADSLSLHAALPALPGVDRPAAAAGHRRDARPRHDAREPGEGERLAGRQGRAVGAVQLQPASAEAVRRAVRDQPVPLRHPHQQPRHDRRAARQPGAGQAADADELRATLAELCRGAADLDADPAQLSRTRSCCASACATSSARRTFKPRRPLYPTWRPCAWSKSPAKRRPGSSSASAGR